MAEFLIRIRDKALGHNPMLLGEREVVSVCADGWKWTRLEQTNPDWRILKVPGMTVAEGEALTAPEPVDETKYIRRRRAFKIDTTLLGVDLRDDKRAVPIVEVKKAVFDASKVVRTPMLRTDVIAPVAVIVKAKK